MHQVKNLVRDRYRMYHGHSFYIIRPTRLRNTINVGKAERNFYAATRNSREVIFEWEAAGGSDKAHSRLDNGLWQVRYCLRVEEVPLLHAVDNVEFFFNLIYRVISRDFQPRSQKFEIKKKKKYGTHTHTSKRVLCFTSLWYRSRGHFHVPNTHCARSR